MVKENIVGELNESRFIQNTTDIHGSNIRRLNMLSVTFDGYDEESKFIHLRRYGIKQNQASNDNDGLGSSIGIAAVAFRYQNVYGPTILVKSLYWNTINFFST
jgi:dTDP-L-rhamnose 4-epimerase